MKDVAADANNVQWAMGWGGLERDSDGGNNLVRDCKTIGVADTNAHGQI